MRRRRMKWLVIVLVSGLVCFSMYFIWGDRLLDTGNAYLRKAGRISLDLQVSAGIASARTLVYVTDISVRRTVTHERRKILDSVLGGYDKLEEDEQGAFIKGVENLFLEAPSLHHLHTVADLWGEKLSHECIIKALLSDDSDVRLFARVIIEDRQKEFPPELLIRALTTLLHDGVASNDTDKMRDGLRTAYDLNMRQVIVENQTLIRELLKSENPFLRNWAGRCLGKIAEKDVAESKKE